MLGHPDATDWSLDPPKAELVEQICNAFETAWKAAADGGPRPRIEDYLSSAPQELQTDLTQELLAIELEYRRGHGETPTLEEYRARLPDYFNPLTLRGQRPLLRRPRFPETVDLLKAGSATAPVSMPGRDPTPLTGLAGYAILEEVGRGGMGVVYKARQIGLKREVALKMIRPEALAGPELLGRFRIEAEAAGRLQHPNIIQIFEVGESEGRPFFSMEFAAGGSLDKKLAGQPLPPQQAAELAQTLARAVHHAHLRDIIHRDLKPANVLLTGDGRPLISDFGLAKRMDSDTGWTKTGAVLGSASYMSPEQAEGKTKEISKPADIYALGAIFYELLTGRPPFRAETWQGTVHMVIHEHPAPPAHLRPELPRELEAICLKCLEKQPDQRYLSAEDLAEDLRLFLAGEAISVITAGAEHQWLAAPARRAGYELLEEIGRGPKSVVYRARQRGLLRPVALKLIPTQTPLDPERMAILFETKLVNRLAASAGFVEVYDFGEQDGMYYVAMDLLPGGNLSRRLADNLWPLRRAVELVEKLAQAMGYAHSRAIIHGNLKPSNVFFGRADEPEISDFDIIADLTSDVNIPPGVLGAPSNYMAPEQKAGRRHEIGPPCDVYALGAILYHLLTGQPPVPAEEPATQVGSQGPVPPSRLRPEVSPGLEAICLKCLEVEPAKRYPNAKVLAENLQRYLAPKKEEARLGIDRLYIPSYEILTKIGHGPRGTVYKARQNEPDRTVAIKLINLWKKSPPEDLAAFVLEAKAASELRHPNIVEIYDVGERDGFLYLVMEHVSGGSLRERLLGKPWVARSAPEFLLLLARAIHFAHERGSVHGDLVPHNVLFTSEGLPKISDFGLAVQHDLLLDVVQLRRVKPTTSYKEAMANRKATGIGVDIYALGGILYEILAGRPPLSHHPMLREIQGAVSQEVEAPSRYQPDVPPDLERICLKCLRKEREKRYLSAAALATDLQHFLAGEAISLGEDEDSLKPPQGAIPTRAIEGEASQPLRPGIWSRLTRWLKRE